MTSVPAETGKVARLSSVIIRVHLAAAMVDQTGTLTVNAAVDSQQKAESSALVQWPLDTGSNMAKSTESTSRSLATAAIVRTLNAWNTFHSLCPCRFH